MYTIDEIISGFHPISLDQMDEVKLMDRMDQKYVFHSSGLPEIIGSMKQDYFVFEINDTRYCGYETQYLDTPDRRMYTLHQNGKLNRHKIRYRKYCESNIEFFEIKFKSNKGRTLKNRIKLKENAPAMERMKEQLLSQFSPYTLSMLYPALDVSFKRITLVNKHLTDRLTLDTDLKFRIRDQEYKTPGLVIAEIKQGRSKKSSFTRVMHAHHINPFPVSKYCLGISLLEPDVKKNNYKMKVLGIQKIIKK